MWLNQKRHKAHLYIVGMSAALAFFGLLFLTVESPVTLSADALERATSCDEANVEAVVKVDCFRTILNDEVATRGSAAAMRLFAYLYDQYVSFSDTSCHLHAHAVGDAAYYYEYRSTHDIQRMEFDETMRACGYGYFHGLFEHLMQHEPDAGLTDQICSYLDRTYADIIPYIEGTCYHGSGHGFMLAQLDTSPDLYTENISTLMEKPFALCDALKTTLEYIDECKSGIFVLFTTFVEQRDLGFYMSQENIYSPCLSISDEHTRRICYKEFSRRTGWAVVGLQETYDYMKRYIPTEWFIENFWIYTKGILAFDSQSSHEEYVTWCRTLVDTTEQETCFTAIPHGLLQHGPPGKEYQPALAFCEQPFLTDNERTLCYENVSYRIKNFLAPLTPEAVCSLPETPARFCVFILQPKTSL